TAPQVSPDGRSVAFFRNIRTPEGPARMRLEILDLNGGAPRVLGDLRAATGIRWISTSRFFVVDQDGMTMRRFDPLSGEIGKGTALGYCLAPSSPDNGQSL